MQFWRLGNVRNADGETKDHHGIFLGSSKTRRGRDGRGQQKQVDETKMVLDCFEFAIPQPSFALKRDD
jgi:hypothetical protein